MQSPPPYSNGQVSQCVLTTIHQFTDRHLFRRYASISFLENAHLATSVDMLILFRRFANIFVRVDVNLATIAEMHMCKTLRSKVDPEIANDRGRS